MAGTQKDIKLIEYKVTIKQLNMTVKSQNELILSLKDTIASNQEQMRIMTEQIEYLTRKLFGTSSEKSKNIEGQYSLFDEAEQEASQADESEAAELVPVKEHTRKAKSRQSDIFRGVPSRDEIIPLSEDQKFCAGCGTQMQVIGKEFVRREFHFTPSKGEVVNIYVETAKCPVCSEVDEMEKAVSFVKSEAPEALIPHSYATASVAAWVMYQKYVNSLPLYRQEQDWKQMGVQLNRATLANWIIYCSSHYFEPFYDYLHRELLKRKFLVAYETRIQVLHEKERRAETDSFMWLFRSGEYGLPGIILYRYTETRAGFNAAEFLKGFEGYLETDCYQGYNGVLGIRRCCCFAHLRRYFIEAVPK